MDRWKRKEGPVFLAKETKKNFVSMRQGRNDFDVTAARKKKEKLTLKAGMTPERRKGKGRFTRKKRKERAKLITRTQL